MSTNHDQQIEWDYVIVGGGSAGCVLANRLSADPGTSVLLLEAGGWDRHLLLRIPAGMAKLPDKFDWRYLGAPDPSRDGLVDPWASGKVLGGGSSINMMMWVRGERSDFDSWRDQGCPGWSYDDVLPYFKLSETFPEVQSPYRGRSGPIGVMRFAMDLEVVDDFLSAAATAGHKSNPDYNGEIQQGVSLAQLSQRRGFRSSTARAYLAPARKRKNLTIRTGALVSRVLLEGTRATGVEYVLDNQRVTARASAEVIMSAGSLASPKLLMLSGIGPADHLREHDINVNIDLPSVGTNLQEHAYGMMMYNTKARTLADELKPTRALKALGDYAMRGRGPLTASGGAAVIFSQIAGKYPTETEIILMPVGLSFNRSEGLDPLVHDLHDVHDVKILPHRMMVYPSFVHPEGRGTVRLASNDPTSTPIIEHELVSRNDMSALIAACRQAREIFHTPEMRAKAVGEEVPGDSVQTDEEWTAFLRKSAFRPFHPSGTCRMGSDGGSVVDPELRVQGAEGLRVVDASIFPTITSGNTNAPTIMVAERAADLIRNRSPRTAS